MVALFNNIEGNLYTAAVFYSHLISLTKTVEKSVIIK